MRNFSGKLRQLIGKYAAKRAPEAPFSRFRIGSIRCKCLAFRELEGLARLCTAVLLALNSARVAGEETTLLQDGAQIRFETGQRLGYPMTHRASLARQSTASHGADHVVLASSGRSDQRLLNHHPKHRTGEIDFYLACVDQYLAGAGLDPDASDRVLAFASGVGAAVLVDFLDVFRRFRSGGLQ